MSKSTTAIFHYFASWVSGACSSRPSAFLFAFLIQLGLLIGLSLLTAPGARASADAAETHFASGIEAFKKNDLKAALEDFENSAKADPASTVALHNLALVEWKLGHPGVAIALWRRALAINGAFEPADNGISWLKNKLDHTEISHEVEYWESFRSSFLNSTSLTFLVVLTAISCLLSGWLLLGFQGQRRRAIHDETPGPAFPTFGLVMGAICGVLAILSLAKVYDSTVPRGTVVAKKIEARSAPDMSSTPLFDLYEGLEVIIDQGPRGWLQVTYPGGPTGWIPEDALMRTSADAPLILPKLPAVSDMSEKTTSDASPAPPAGASPGVTAEKPRAGS